MAEGASIEDVLVDDVLEYILSLVVTDVDTDDATDGQRAQTILSLNRSLRTRALVALKGVITHWFKRIVDALKRWDGQTPLTSLLHDSPMGTFIELSWRLRLRPGHILHHGGAALFPPFTETEREALLAYEEEELARDGADSHSAGLPVPLESFALLFSTLFRTSYYRDLCKAFPTLHTPDQLGPAHLIAMARFTRIKKTDFMRSVRRMMEVLEPTPEMLAMVIVCSDTNSPAPTNWTDEVAVLEAYMLNKMYWRFSWGMGPYYEITREPEGPFGEYAFAPYLDYVHGARQYWTSRQNLDMAAVLALCVAAGAPSDISDALAFVLRHAIPSIQQMPVFLRLVQGRTRATSAVDRAFEQLPYPGTRRPVTWTGDTLDTDVLVRITSLVDLLGFLRLRPAEGYAVARRAAELYVTSGHREGAAAGITKVLRALSWPNVEALLAFIPEEMTETSVLLLGREHYTNGSPVPVEDFQGGLGTLAHLLMRHPGRPADQNPFACAFPLFDYRRPGNANVLLHALRYGIHDATTMELLTYARDLVPDDSRHVLTDPQAVRRFCRKLPDSDAAVSAIVVMLFDAFVTRQEPLKWDMLTWALDGLARDYYMDAEQTPELLMRIPDFSTRADLVIAHALAMCSYDDVSPATHVLFRLSSHLDPIREPLLVQDVMRLARQGPHADLVLNTLNLWGRLTNVEHPYSEHKGKQWQGPKGFVVRFFLPTSQAALTVMRQRDPGYAVNPFSVIATLITVTRGTSWFIASSSTGHALVTSLFTALVHLPDTDTELVQWMVAFHETNPSLDTALLTVTLVQTMRHFHALAPDKGPFWDAAEDKINAFIASLSTE